MGALGAFTFVLHSHLPYARLAGRWPHGEEWIHEAASETYIPLLKTLYDLKEEGIEYKLTLGITPVLAEQLADPLVLEHFDQYLDARIKAAERDITYYGHEESAEETPDTEMYDVERDNHLYYLAGWYKGWYEDIKQTFHDRFDRDIIGAFRRLQDDGHIEIITSAATHGYLPLLGRDSSIRGQLKTGIATHQRHFGTTPTTAWLPECAYRPAYIEDDGTTRPGLEKLLSEHDFKVFFTETHAITGGQPVGVAAGDVIGPYGDIKRRYVIPAAATPVPPKRNLTTYQAYHIADTIKGGEDGAHVDVAIIGRNNRTGQQVWSADWGYPGDFDYREFHKKAGTSGLQYWRVTGAKTDLAHKDYYHPEWASFKVDQHAEHFAHLVGDLLREHYNDTGEYGIIASNYDTELFGHWWFEGVGWLGKVIRHLAENPEIDMVTATEYVQTRPPEQTLNIPESSWGVGGTHFSWRNGEVEWMWEPIHEAERRMETLVAKFPDASGDEQKALNQAARELLLLQSSDWPFLITTGQAREYAIQRFNQHIERFDQLAQGLENDQPNAAYAEQLYELDKVFPDIDYRWFAD